MTTDTAQGPVDVNVSRLTTENGTPQYYYKDNACHANAAQDEDCICWHDEGTGPFPDERPDDPDALKEWRFKPANASFSRGPSGPSAGSDSCTSVAGTEDK